MKPIQVDGDDIAQKGGVRKLTLTTKETNELTGKIRGAIDQMTAQRQDWVVERNTDVKAYFGIKKKSEWPFKGAAKVASQFHRLTVDTVAANMLKSMRGPEKPIAVAPMNSDSLENAKYVEDLINAQAAHEFDLFTVLDRAIPNALVESYSVIKPSWQIDSTEVEVTVCRLVPADKLTPTLSYDLDTDTVFDSQTQETIVSVDPDTIDLDADDKEYGDLKEVEFNVTKEEVRHDGIKLNVIGASRFFMPIFSPGETPFEKVQRAPYVAQQLFYTHDEVMQLGEEGYFDNTDVVSAENYDRARELLTQLKIEVTGFNLDSQVQKEMVEVFEWHGKFAFGVNAQGKPSKKQREIIVWQARSTGKILRAEMNVTGIREFFPLVPFPVDDTPYGESLPKIIRNLVAELDLLMNTVINISLMKAAPPKFYDPASGFDPGTIGNIGPNSWIPARDPSRNVYIPPQPEDPAIAMQMVQLLINLIERVTSVNEVVQGQVSDRANTTATEVSQALVRSGVRFDALYERLKSQLKPMFNYIHKLDLRHMPALKEMQYMGGLAKDPQSGQSRLLSIQKAQIQGQFGFDIAGNSVVTEQNELQKAITLFNTIGQNPYISYKPDSVYYMLYNIVKHLNPVAMDKILPTPQEVQQLLKDRQLVQQEQEHQAQQQMQDQMQSQGQAQAQTQQMELMKEHQQMQMAAEKHQMDMQMKQKEFEQKMTHNDQAHQLKLKQMEEQRAQMAKKAADGK